MINLIPPVQLSAAEVVYNKAATGLTGAVGYSLSPAEMSGNKQVVAQVTVGDVASGITGQASCVEVSFKTAAADHGMTGLPVLAVDQTTLAGATGPMPFVVDEAVCGCTKTYLLNSADFQGKLYATAKGLTGAPAISVSLV